MAGELGAISRPSTILEFQFPGSASTVSLLRRRRQPGEHGESIVTACLPARDHGAYSSLHLVEGFVLVLPKTTDWAAGDVKPLRAPEPALL
jgi:hypothetical protein